MISKAIPFDKLENSLLLGIWSLRLKIFMSDSVPTDKSSLVVLFLFSTELGLNLLLASC